MKTKVLFLLSLVALLSISVHAQRGVRIGYIDTEYILQNVPEYNEASTQLEGKVQKWKTEIDKRLAAIDQKKKQLETEKVLLTSELYEERAEDIAFEEKEILDYQQKRFGPNGDLMIQKQQLIQPVQDQIFAAVQEIASKKKYDFVFDKSADVVMLFSAKRFDISEQVLRSITRTSKRKQAKNRKERKEAEAEDVVPVVDLEKEAKDKEIQAKRDSRNSDREAKKKALAEKKAKILEDRKKARQAKIDARNKKRKGSTPPQAEEDQVEDIQAKEEAKEKVEESTEKAEETTKAKEPELTDRERRKRALEEKKKKIIEARRKKLEARKKAKEAKDNKDDN